MGGAFLHRLGEWDHGSLFLWLNDLVCCLKMLFVVSLRVPPPKPPRVHHTEETGTAAHATTVEEGKSHPLLHDNHADSEVVQDDSNSEGEELSEQFRRKLIIIHQLTAFIRCAFSRSGEIHQPS